jgi:hypothetical protein
MIKYLISAVNTVRVHTVADVEALHEELKHNPNFELVQFSYTTKDIKEKREVVDQYQLVKAKLVFTNEKEPEAVYEVEYNEV